MERSREVEGKTQEWKNINDDLRFVKGERSEGPKNDLFTAHPKTGSDFDSQVKGQVTAQGWKITRIASWLLNRWLLRSRVIATRLCRSWACSRHPSLRF